MTNTTHFIVMTAAACMPASCWGRYRRVAVVEVEGDARPVMISTRARGVVRIVSVWERLYVGKSMACAYQVALAEAERLCAELNGDARHSRPVDSAIKLINF